MLNRSKIWAATLLLSVFAAGIAIGGPAWGAVTDVGGVERGRRGDPPESRSRERRSYSEHLQEDLNLSVEQRAAVALDEQRVEVAAGRRKAARARQRNRREVAVGALAEAEREVEVDADLVSAITRRYGGL